ncbi:glycine betaine ABC transporter substrate-binding protein [Natribacillus halophilus]|uniref:Glycine betaine/proline transport system substrate-binding protein n=1 Tax=Natribacillus halophilus TaxID=549003 RepID=A0A1G8SKR5_9BACI|nr:glycine betaine ABC transporter substrate-binding protein [Natribacillus halophilus]SDJ29210.1 glycine betaine/proline transport system substrate-binding protein [Natribacillus halophilus]
MTKYWTRLSLLTSLSLILVAAGCGADDDEDTGAQDDNGDTEETEEDGDDGDDADGEAAGDYAEELDYTITGIDPGAGIMGAAEQALEDYDNLDDWTLQSSSETAMIAEMEEAIENEEPIVITGWDPHWKFVDHDLKYLDDPEGSFGEPEDIDTLVREGLQDDHPEAYEILDNFEWTADDMAEIMYDIVVEDEDPLDAGQTWYDENEDVVNSWTEGVDEVDGESFEIVHGPWETDYSTVGMMTHVLEDMGYDVETTNVEANYMYQAVADDDADAMLGAWLPDTHGEYYEPIEDEVENLGANMEAEAALGLVVPEYMDIDSIEDLEG